MAALLLAGALTGCVRHRTAPGAGLNMPPPDRPRLSVSPFSAPTNATPRPLAVATVAPPAVAAGKVDILAPKTNAPAAKPAAAAAPAATEGGVVAYRLRPNDPVVIFLRGILPKDDQIEDIIDEDGFVKMPYLDGVLAAGKTTSQLENEIQRLYIDRQIYKHITVNVVMPSQSYFVQGEVKSPGRFPMVTGVTLLQAIATAGGYTDFADRTDVRITRGSTTTRYNSKEIERHPERDLRIEPGDVIIVTRGII